MHVVMMSSLHAVAVRWLQFRCLARLVDDSTLARPLTPKLDREESLTRSIDAFATTSSTNINENSGRKSREWDGRADRRLSGVPRGRRHPKFSSTAQADPLVGLGRRGASIFGAAEPSLQGQQTFDYSFPRISASLRTSALSCAY